MNKKLKRSGLIAKTICKKANHDDRAAAAKSCLRRSRSFRDAFCIPQEDHDAGAGIVTGRREDEGGSRSDQNPTCCCDRRNGGDTASESDAAFGCDFRGGKTTRG